MKAQLAMVIDSSACIDCRACMAACKVENRVPDGVWRNWIKRREPDFERLPRAGEKASLHFQPGGCMHCDRPSCIEACPTGATFKDSEDGTVRVDKSLCIGCGSCIPACPYGARYRHPETKAIDKCDFCEKRRARGELPACVVTCPTKARVFGNLKDPKSDAARLVARNRTVRVVNRVVDTAPNIFYLAATAPLDWPVEPKFDTPLALWKMINPFVWGVVGLNALGVLAMLGRQLIGDDTEPAEGEIDREGKSDV